MFNDRERSDGRYPHTMTLLISLGRDRYNLAISKNVFAGYKRTLADSPSTTISY